jgi:uroporphyrinogen-III decarboxylase
MKVVTAYVECGAERVTFGDDLGLQDRLPVSPDHWRALTKPAYDQLFERVRNAGAEVYLHTDGYILDIIPDLIDCGVTILNPQDLVNGLHQLAETAKGRVHIDLDIDRQTVTVFGTPGEIDTHIRTCVETLGSRDGGLSLVYGAYPGTPPENVAAVIRGMQAYHDLWM